MDLPTIHRINKTRRNYDAAASVAARGAPYISNNVNKCDRI